mmetsp:Transcript_105653/g.340740  ORF Transcript_105653/g.340740 Transcript_105653/m.340740 type:complete len:100 (+) Transcript_105653:551-850(+)
MTSCIVTSREDLCGVSKAGSRGALDPRHPVLCVAKAGKACLEVLELWLGWRASALREATGSTASAKDSGTGRPMGEAGGAGPRGLNFARPMGITGVGRP